MADDIYGDITEENAVAAASEASEAEAAPAQKLVTVIGVKFKEGGKVYYFDPVDMVYTEDDCVIVETTRGVEFGYVACGNKEVPPSEVVAPLRRAMRKATPDDILRHDENVERAKEAAEICSVKMHEFGMKLVEAEYTFDNSKLIFYFTADGRVDFRELLPDLARYFHTRIDLRQIGIRDEAKLLGGLGVCGRPFCCSSFLSDFVQVSIKMAKEQNLSLNSSKISGACGRLMCCLRYEYDTYEAELKLTPRVGSKVSTPDGPGTVVEIYPLQGNVKAVVSDRNGPATKLYHRDNVTVLSAPPADEGDSADKRGKRRDDRRDSRRRPPRDGAPRRTGSQAKQNADAPADGEQT